MSVLTSQRRSIAPPPVAHAPRKGRRAWTARGHLAAAALLTIAFVSPIYLTIVNAFKSQNQILANPEALPAPPTLHNLSDALSRPDRIIQIGLTNSAVTVVASVLLITRSARPSASG